MAQLTELRVQGTHLILRLDCNLFETHNYVSNVTNIPVEDGTSIIDNISDVPLELTIEAIIGGGDRIEKFDIINTMRTEGSFLEITTPFKSHRNMVITGISVVNSPEASTTTGAIRCTIKLKQVTIVKSLQQTTVAAKYRKNKPKGKPKKLPGVLTFGEPTVVNLTARETRDAEIKETSEAIRKSIAKRTAKRNAMLLEKLKVKETTASKQETIIEFSHFSPF